TYADGPAVPRHSGLTPAPAPAGKPLDPGKAKRVRGMFAGTTAMKIGMETVALSIPLLALQTMGGATLVAGLVVVYGLAQAAFAGAAGGLLDRLPPPKVLAGAVVAQAVLVASIITLGAAGLLTPLTLFPLYMLVGGAVGIAETARHSIPPLILGHNKEDLSRYNARLHIFYEVAGVTGALATGALITFIGPLWALALQPPAYLLGGFLFWRVKLAEKAMLKARFLRPALSDLRERIAEYFKDLRAGAGLVLKNDRLRWVAVAFVLSQIVHRILEGLLVPLFANRVLLDPGAAGYLLTAANMGELIGAVLLLRYAAKIKAPTWVKWGALAMGLSWVMAFTSYLPFVLPVILLMSMTRSASDLSLRAEVQSSLGAKDQPRATSFLYGAFVLGTAAISLGMGALFDLLPITLALAGVFTLFTVLAAAVFHASRRLSSQKPK
ncbi:MAG: MFS transporter, partial [Elusimicrobiota bacterium]